MSDDNETGENIVDDALNETNGCNCDSCACKQEYPSDE